MARLAGRKRVRVVTQLAVVHALQPRVGGTRRGGGRTVEPRPAGPVLARKGLVAAHVIENPVVEARAAVPLPRVGRVTRLREAAGAPDLGDRLRAGVGKCLLRAGHRPDLLPAGGRREVLRLVAGTLVAGPGGLADPGDVVSGQLGVG